MNKGKIAALGAGLVLVGASVLGAAAPAFAESVHGPYGTKSACIASAGNYEIHGYVIFKNCYYSAGPYMPGWYFITTP